MSRAPSRSRSQAPADQRSFANTGRSRARSQPREQQRPGKRLILCEDGTWLNSDSGSLKGALAIPSNITRLARAIKSISSDSIPQVTYYHFGVGAGSGVLDKVMGATGSGLAEIVREGWHMADEFLATNWVPGDEIFIFGFSRGAFAARAIAGLVGEVGILTRTGLPYFPEIFRDVENKHDENYVPKHPDLPFPDKPSAMDPAYTDELRRRRMTRLDVPIKVVGVFDTVGALGTPKIGWLTRLGLQSKAMKELSFYDTSLGDCIEYAFQALALDERRYSFQPTLWEKLKGNNTVLRQVWFPGAHSNIGGGNDDQQIPFLDFDTDYLLDQWEAVEDYYKKHDEKPRPWSFGEIFDGLTGIYVLGGMKVRTPGRYCLVDPTNGKQTRDPLMETHEYIHPSVRARVKLNGPGVHDRGGYECKALRDWKLNIEAREDGGKGSDVFWRSRDRPEEGFMKILPEAPLKGLETELLQYDPETRDYVLKPAGVRQRRSTRDKSRRRSPED
ncbi:hypothetical protein LTR53_007837 [Teratosphaeriaceae sp. CCFEE 6253]|nr:hypothetical protein LTR53_007837 [Teratosphaeriaceae sp. CCFEE 6253]